MINVLWHFKLSPGLTNHLPSTWIHKEAIIFQRDVAILNIKKNKTTKNKKHRMTHAAVAGGSSSPHICSDISWLSSLWIYIIDYTSEEKQQKSYGNAVFNSFLMNMLQEWQWEKNWKGACHVVVSHSVGLVFHTLLLHFLSFW